MSPAKLLPVVLFSMFEYFTLNFSTYFEKHKEKWSFYHITDKLEGMTGQF